MKTSSLATFAALTAFAFSTATAAFAGETLTLRAADGVQVEAELWRASGDRPPIVLAFHQAEASRAEYEPIAPRLVAAGYTVLAIDQRSGDGAFGGRNRTVERLGRSTGYDEALPDLEAALAWARANGRGAPVVALGSSYSAALVFVLAARHPDALAAVVAFSPGEYLGSKTAVRDAARKVRVPVWVDQASDAEEVRSAKEIVEAVGGAGKQQFVSRGASVHGASTLRKDRNASGAEAHWTALLAFLASVRR